MTDKPFTYKPLRKINPDKLQFYLREHPDRKLVHYLVNGFDLGFKLDIADRPQPRPPCQNSRAVRHNPEATHALIREEVQKGHVLGPFTQVPLPNLVFSPLNIVPKSGSPNCFRLIHDLAYPYSKQQSINSCIPREAALVQYCLLDDVIHMAQEIGPNTLGARIDIRHAFHNLPIHADDIHLLAFSFNGAIYINSSLPFGVASSCAIFERVACALQWIVIHHSKRSSMSHFLDDFPLLESSPCCLCQFMTEFEDIMQDIGMPIAANKTLGPTPVLEYLGLLLDFPNQVIKIPLSKRTKCLKLIDSFLSAHAHKRKVTVKTVQKLAGSLNFICQALPAGRPFLVSLYRMIRTRGGAKLKAGHHRRISNETSNDLNMFRSFIQANAHLKIQSVPFLNHLNIDSDDIQLYADAAGAEDKGLGCFFCTEWFFSAWSDTSLFRHNFRPNIALLELLAVVTALDLWAPSLQGKTVTLRSDNMATCCFINRKKTDILAAMSLLRHLTLTCLQFQILVKSRHIEGAKNISADLISRKRFQQFRQLNPQADLTPLQPPPSWPPHWEKKDMIPYLR